MPDINTVVVTPQVSVVAVNSSVPGSYDSVARLGLGVFNVQDPLYGATGDGATDDTTAIQAAITAASAISSANATGAVVYFPPGTYNISSGLTLTSSGVQLIGSGSRNTTLYWTGGAAKMLALGTTSVPIFFWGIKGLRFWDNSAAATHGVYLGYAREGTMEDCYFYKGMTTAAVYLSGTTSAGNYSNRFERVTISSTAGDGWYLGGQTNSCFFHDCITSSVTGTSVRITSGFATTFSQCQFGFAVSGVEVGIYGDLSGGRIVGFTFSDCYFELKPATTGARACLVNNSGGNSLIVEYLLFTGGGYSAQGAANYLFESNCTSGTVRAAVMGCGLFNVVTAAVKATTTADHWTVLGQRALNGFGIGSTVPLLDNNSGAASNATSCVWGDGVWTLAANHSATRFLGSGTAHVAGDYAASANWGTTPTITPLARDTGGRVSVLAQATTGANPTLTLTFKDGTWTTAPAITCSRGDTNAVAGYWVLSTISATTAVFTFVGTPTAGQTYILDFHALGK